MQLIDLNKWLVPNNSPYHDNVLPEIDKFYKPYQYICLVHFPKKLEPVPMNAGKLAQRIIQAAIPGRSFSSFEFRQGKARVVKRLYDTIYDTLRLTILCTDDYIEKKMFDKWFNLVFNQATERFSYPDDYESTIEIIKLDNTLDNVYKTKFINVHPKSISEIQQTFEGGSEVDKFEVEFEYEYWVNEPVNKHGEKAKLQSLLDKVGSFFA